MSAATGTMFVVGVLVLVGISLESIKIWVLVRPPN
jgi:hypothetical protein